MEKKNILITGASRGIGKATAIYLAEQGYQVILIAKNENNLKEVADIIGENVYIYPYDLMDLEHISQIYNFISDKGIKLDGLVHCAGVNHDIPIRGNDIELMKETMTINYMSFVELAKYFIKKKYSNDSSSVVAISSSAAYYSPAGMATYASSKAALEVAVKVSAKEFIYRKTRVNAISPNCVDTQMVNDAPFLTGESIVRAQPLGLIEPIQVAYLVEYLLSDRSKYITGSVIPVFAGTT